MTYVPAPEELLPASHQPADSASLLNHEHWDGPLREYAEATGLSVALYDTSLQLTSGMHLASPLAHHLAAAGFWSSGALGAHEAATTGARAVLSGNIEISHSFDMLELAAVPALLGGHVTGVFVCGWMPCPGTWDLRAFERFAGHIGLPIGEVRRLMAAEPPIEEHKLALCAGLLKTLGAALLTRLNDQIRERRAISRLRILNESARALTAATGFEDISRAVDLGLAQLMPGSHVRVLLADKDGRISEMPGAPRTTAAEPVSATEDVLQLARETRRPRVIRVPVQAGDSNLLGVLEIEVACAEVGLPAEVAPLAAQVAVAAQKARLIADLDEERVILDRVIAELKRVSRIRDEFLATISHELKTPLNSMLGWCQLLQSGSLEEREGADALHTIERNARVQARLIDDLLDMSRAITGKLMLELKPMDLIATLNETIESIRAAADTKRLHVSTAFPVGTLPYRGDAVRLTQVFWNLLANAVKFTPEGGQINVSVQLEAERIIVRVTDSGKGIGPEFLGHVFDRFSQEDGSYTRRYSGLGLGLAIVRHLVEMHGGEVSAASPGEGCGSTFSASLPLRVPARGFGTTCLADDACPFPADAAHAASVSSQLDDLHLMTLDTEFGARGLMQSTRE